MVWNLEKGQSTLPSKQIWSNPNQDYFDSGGIVNRTYDENGYYGDEGKDITSTP